MLFVFHTICYIMFVTAGGGVRDTAASSCSGIYMFFLGVKS